MLASYDIMTTTNTTDWRLASCDVRVVIDESGAYDSVAYDKGWQNILVVVVDTQ